MIWNADNGGHPPERKPRLLWLLGFQVFILALVVLMARSTRQLTGQPLLEDRLGPLSKTAITSHIQEAFGGGREWLAVVVAMVGALLLMLPVVWVEVATRAERKVDHSVITTITLLPIAVAAILVIVQDSLTARDCRDRPGRTARLRRVRRLDHATDSGVAQTRGDDEIG